MNSFYWVFYTLFKSISKAFFSWKVVNREKLIEDGPVLIVSNHQSFLDPPMLGISYEEGIYFFARKTLFKGIFKWALPLCQAIPIDQENPDAGRGNPRRHGRHRPHPEQNESPRAAPAHQRSL